MWDPQHKPSPGVKALKQTTGDGVSLWIRDWILALLLLLGFFYWGAVPTTGVSCCGSRACIYIIIYIYIHMFDDDIFAWWFHHEKKGHLLDDDLYYVFRGWNHQFHGDFRIPMIQHPASASVPVTSPHQGWERSHGSGQSQRHLRDIFLDYFSRFFLWFNSLVGGFKHEFYFPFHMWDNPSQLIFICFRGVAQPPSKFNSDTSGVFMG